MVFFCRYWWEICCLIKSLFSNPTNGFQNPMRMVYLSEKSQLRLRERKSLKVVSKDILFLYFICYSQIFTSFIGFKWSHKSNNLGLLKIQKNKQTNNKQRNNKLLYSLKILICFNEVCYYLKEKLRGVEVPLFFLFPLKIESINGFQKTVNIPIHKFLCLHFDQHLSLLIVLSFYFEEFQTKVHLPSFSDF